MNCMHIRFKTIWYCQLRPLVFYPRATFAVLSREGEFFHLCDDIGRYITAVHKSFVEVVE